MDAHLDGWLDGEVGPLCYRARGTHSHPHSNATEHAAERRVTEPPHVALECSRSKIAIEQETATARATT